MAPKRLPLEDPPSASSSEEEEQDIHEVINGKASEEEEEEEEEENHVGEGKSLSEEEDASEDDEEETPSPKPTSIISGEVRLPLESDPGEGSDIESPSASGFTIKPIVSKPLKPCSKPPNPSTPASKPPAETEEAPKESRARKKSKLSYVDEDLAVEHKSAINKLWSEDDEIAILKGLIDYKPLKGANPFTDMGGFHEFVKGSLQADVSKSQLISKIKRLKKKYRINVEKGGVGNPNFSKPHELKSFELSKKIWGSEANSAVVENGKGSKTSALKNGEVDNSLNSQEDKAKGVVLPVALDGLEGEAKANSDDFGSSYLRLNEKLKWQKGLYMSMPNAVEKLVKERMSLIGDEKSKELEEKWKNLRIDEIELYLKRIELIQEQTKLVLAAMRSS